MRMKKLLALLAVLFVSIGAKAYINVYQTNINGKSGYGIYSWSNPGELAQFLNGTYDGTVYGATGKISDWQTSLLPSVKTAEAIKIGGSDDNPKELINGDDLAALSKLTNVVYLDMDGATPVNNLDFSNIGVTSTALLEVTLPTGTTTDQVKAANTKLLTVATGLKLTVAISGTITTTTNPVNYYQIPNTTDWAEYSGTLEPNVTSVPVTDFPVTVDLTLASSAETYTNSLNDDEPITIVSGEGQYADDNTSWIPNNIRVKLTQSDTPIANLYYTDGQGNTYLLSSHNYNYDETTGKYTTVDQWSAYPDYSGGVGPGTEVSVDFAYQYTYKFMKDGWVQTLFYPNTPTEEDGKFIGVVANSYTDSNGQPFNGYKFGVNTSYTYTYTDLNDPTKTVYYTPTTGPDDDLKLDVLYTGSLTVKQENVTTASVSAVDGVTAYVNTPGSLSDASSYLFTQNQLSSYQGAKNITVIGSINDNDLTALNATNFASAEVVNLSGATMAANSSITNLDSKATALIILPSSPTTQELGQIMAHQVAADNSQYYSCLAYYNGENRLSVYAQDGNVAKIAPFVTTSTAVYSLPHYDTNGNIDYYAGGQGGNLTDYVAAFENIPAAFVDFGYVDVNLNCDFTNLHNNTASIRVPMNGTGFDITNVGNKSEFENKGGYTFDDDIKLVSFYVASGVKATINGKEVNTNNTKDIESTNVVMVRESGALDTYHNYLSAEQLHATRQIILTDPNVEGVELTAEDIAELSDCVSDKIDLVDANVSAENLATLSNATVKYLALPGTGASTINGTYTDVVNGDVVTTTVSCDYLENCNQLLCVGALDGTSFTSWSQKKVVNNVQTASVKKVTDMICVTNYSSVNMSGYLCTEDVSSSTALDGAVVKNAIFTNAIFEPDEQMVFGQGTGTNTSVANAGAHWDLSLESIELPTSKSMTTIPANCLSNMQQLTSICIPYNYQNIGNSAFYNDQTLRTITTTDADGNSIDNGENTYTLSSNLLDIDSYAFDTRVPTISDVYALALNAPECDVNAFGDGMVYGWGGFVGNDKHPVCRDNYNNNGVLITMLHFPDDAIDPKKYTDVTRKYTLMDETGAYDGNGNTLYWPLLEEFVQSYNQAMWGVTWESEQGRNYGKEGTLHPNDGTGTNTYNTKYAGWHQFVLSNYGHSAPTPLATEYFEDDYYTLCFPFDMSRDEVLSILGVNYSKIHAANPQANVTVNTETEVEADLLPKVYTLKSVTRIGSMITLEFSQDLMALAETDGKTIEVDVAKTNGYDYEKGITARNDGENVYLKGGYPYLVKPILPTGTTISSGLAKYIMSKHEYTKNELGNTIEIDNSTEYFAAPIADHKVIATDGTNRLYNGTTPYYYYFQGTYIEMDLPLYAYFLGKRNSDSSKRFFRSTTPGRKWSAYSSIIGGKCPEDAFTITQGTENDKNYITGNATYSMTVDNDDFETAGVKYQFTIEGEDGFDEAVNIEKIDGEVVGAAALEGDVFNVAGQRVATSVEGLSKGLYIVNGKKVLVK